MKTSTRRLLPALALLAAGAAQAHPGHGVASLAQGLAHPWLGADHLLAMLAVGLWSAAALPRAQRLLGPAVFLASLLAGALLALAGLPLPLPGIEPAVAGSVVLLGALLLAGERLGRGAGLCALLLAGLLHGAAHGSEAGADSLVAAYAAGFLLSSALLHGLGLAAGQGLRRLAAWAREGAALLLACSGLFMLAARL